MTTAGLASTVRRVMSAPVGVGADSSVKLAGSTKDSTNSLPLARWITGAVVAIYPDLTPRKEAGCSAGEVIEMDCLRSLSPLTCPKG